MSFYDSRPFVDDDEFSTLSSVTQKETEKKVEEKYKKYLKNEEFYFKNLKLFKKKHTEMLIEGLDFLPKLFTSLDASKPWLLYWITHGLDLLGSFEGKISQKYSPRIIAYLKILQDNTGGFCGGVGQLPHLAGTYASINTIAIIGTKEAYSIVNKKTLYDYFLRRKDKKSGGFTMHDDGEVDIRGCYCVLSCACLLNIITPELSEGVTKYILNCQTFEGGMSAFPMNEAHGGYAFCGLSALMILKKAHLLDINALIHWCVRRQMSFEGGFQGRTNKLVDSCYSFWMGGNFPLLNALLASMKKRISRKERRYYEKLQWKPPKELKQKVFVYEDDRKKGEKKNDDDDVLMDIPKLDGYVEFGEENLELLMNQTALQQYVVVCCQIEDGGMIDKPGKWPDYYHTCYSLSGLSIAQHNTNKPNAIFGDKDNLLNEINPIFNVRSIKARRMIKYFGNRDCI